MSIDDNILRYMPQTLSIENILHNFGMQFSIKVQEAKHSCDFTAISAAPTPTTPQQSLYITLPNEEVIKYIISKLKTRKGPGYDGVEVKDIKNANQNLIKFITSAIRNYIQRGIFPQCLKTSIVRPIYKGGAHKDVSNYRPISILSVLDKIFERYLSIVLINYLQEFDILDCRQYAYQKGKGVENLLADLSDYINTNLSQRLYTIGLFFDLSKAFDVLDHKILLEKLENIGIRGKMLNLFASYLNKRLFCVKIDGKLGEKVNIDSGVPQGSILGPLLFIIYLNDLFPHIKVAKILIFADDILILYQHKDLNLCSTRMQSEADAFNEWAHDNGLVINRKKTVGMLFCTKAMKPEILPKIKIHKTTCLHNFQVNCDCDYIDFVSTTKYLGVFIDDDFGWMTHVNHVKNKMRSVIREIKLAKSRLSGDALRTIYFSLAYSHLTYGISAWGHACPSALSQLQEKLLYTMASKKQLKTHDGNLFKIWQVLPLNLIFEKHICILKYFDAEHGIRRMHSYQTRTALNEPLFEPVAKNKHHERTWNYIIPRIWNKLPLNLKSISDKKRAKDNINLWYLNQVTSS
jgi:retron-type reverse transcriptase